MALAEGDDGERRNRFSARRREHEREGPLRRRRVADRYVDFDESAEGGAVRCLGFAAQEIIEAQAVILEPGPFALSRPPRQRSSIKRSTSARQTSR